MLKREDINRQRIDRIFSDARAQGEILDYSHEEREHGRRQFLEDLPPNKDLWVFGYGSLMWNPAFRYAQISPARLFGFHRNFCLELTIGRGSPDNPGLMLALDHGGSCNGLAFRIDATEVESETDILWMREMVTGAYRARWAKLELDGEVVRGLVFTINRNHMRYRGKMSWTDKIDRLSTGTGPLGSCREYLQNTVEHLDQIDVHDRYLHRLWNAVKGL